MNDSKTKKKDAKAIEKKNEESKPANATGLKEILDLEQRLIGLKKDLIKQSSRLSEDLDEEELVLLLVESGGKRFATPISLIDEVLQMPALEPVDNEKAAVAGLLNFHGKTLAVVDLSRLLEYGPTQVDPEKVVLICTVGSRQFGVVVDDAIEVLSIRADSLVAADEVLPGLLKAAGVVRLPHVVALVLDMASVGIAAEFSGAEDKKNNKSKKSKR